MLYLRSGLEKGTQVCSRVRARRVCVRAWAGVCVRGRVRGACVDARRRGRARACAWDVRGCAQAWACVCVDVRVRVCACARVGRV